MDEHGIFNFDRFEIKFLFLTRKRIESVGGEKYCLFSINSSWFDKQVLLGYFVWWTDNSTPMYDLYILIISSRSWTR
jgi:hypothetical protein